MIDLRKPYDLVSWDFLKGILDGLDFLPRFIDWVMKCTTIPSCSIALNGSLHAFIKIVERDFDKVILYLTFCLCYALSISLEC